MFRKYGKVEVSVINPNFLDLVGYHCLGISTHQQLVSGELNDSRLTRAYNQRFKIVVSFKINVSMPKN